MQTEFEFIPVEKHNRRQRFFSDVDPLALKDFMNYHKKNRHLYEIFEKYSLEAARSGRKRFSIWMIANRVRWYSMIETSGKNFKISMTFSLCTQDF